jgi:hypothetical protein
MKEGHLKHPVVTGQGQLEPDRNDYWKVLNEVEHLLRKNTQLSEFINNSIQHYSHESIRPLLNNILKNIERNIGKCQHQCRHE